MTVGRWFEQKPWILILAIAVTTILAVVSQLRLQPDSLAAVRGTENDDPLDYKVYLPLVCRSGSATPTTTPTAPTTYYVSKMGSNADGRSWVTAWNELDQINWDVINPGDTILLDGGPTGMVYTTTLTVGKSGTPARPITITLASEPGRDGRVVIFGGRSTPLPYCEQTDYTYETAGVRSVGIFLDQMSWIVIDGRKWSGIIIYGHNQNGIRLYRSWDDYHNYPLCEHIVFRGLEIYDNGSAWESDGVWNPDEPGVDLTGRHITFERVIVHDNGQDAFMSGGIIEDITLRRVWLYNRRPHPIETDDVWNYCTHSDGVQIFHGGNQYGLVVEDSIIGPGFMQGLLLGQYGSETQVATIHNVTISNTLIVGHHGESDNTGLTTLHDPDGHEYPNDPPTNYEINRVTCVRDVDKTWWNLLIHGSGHTVVDSIFVGGLNLYVDGGPTVSNNYWWQLRDLGGIGIEADPMFVDDAFPGVGIGFADFNFETQNPAVSGAGSSITAPDDLLGD